MIETSISFMKKNLHCSLSLEELSQNIHYSVSYFSSLFKKETGYSPIDYYIYLKIQKACQYLDLTDLNVSEIAQKIGYDDNHYFSRLFHKVMDFLRVNIGKNKGRGIGNNTQENKTKDYTRKFFLTPHYFPLGGSKRRFTLTLFGIS